MTLQSSSSLIVFQLDVYKEQDIVQYVDLRYCGEAQKTR
jgi:hypothetical protein